MGAGTAPSGRPMEQEDDTMIETKGLGGMRKLLIERYAELRDVLKREGSNVFTVGTETINHTTYFRVILKR